MESGIVLPFPGSLKEGYEARGKLVGLRVLTKCKIPSHKYRFKVLFHCQSLCTRRKMSIDFYAWAFAYTKRVEGC